MLVFVSGGESFLTLVGKDGQIKETIPGSSANAKAAYKAALKRGCVESAKSPDSDLVLGRERDRFDAP